MSVYSEGKMYLKVPCLNKRGFTLTELIVVMGIFLTIMLITASAFKTIVNNSSQQSKSVETQIGGIVGLEIFRADLAQAGFGLPWAFRSTPSTAAYLEASDPTYNDATGDPPRAILSGSNNSLFVSYPGSSYIVIKSAAVAANETSKKWTNVSFAEGVKKITTWGDPRKDLATNDRVIVVKNSLNTTPTTRQLMVSNGTDSLGLSPVGSFYTTFGNYSALTLPHLDGDTFQVYGIGTGSIRMPFNRADYFISNDSATDIPVFCAPNTGVLYKATINHSDGNRNRMPLLDCVADMQIVYGLDSNGDGIINQYLDAPANTTPPSAADIRSQLKEIRVYILAQDGKKDITFSYPNPSIDVGETLLGGFWGRQYAIGSAYKNYRWKVYTIVVRPKNLIQ